MKEAELALPEDVPPEIAVGKKLEAAAKASWVQIGGR
jgi:hypothetical protein